MSSMTIWFVQMCLLRFACSGCWPTSAKQALVGSTSILHQRAQHPVLAQHPRCATRVSRITGTGGC